MSIYKNKEPIHSNQELLRTGENALYQFMNIKDIWIANLIKSIIFLVLSSISLPLRLVFRSKIGERSIGFVPALTALILYTYLIVSSIAGLMTIEDWDSWTWNRFNLTQASEADSTLMLADLIGNKLPSLFYEENEKKYSLGLNLMTWEQFENLKSEAVQISEAIESGKKTINDLSPKEELIYLEIPSMFNFYSSNLRVQYRAFPFSLLFLYMGLFWCFLSVYFAEHSGIKMPRLKWHSYHRGKSILNWILKGNQTLIWIIEAVIFFLLGWLFISFKLVQWKIVGIVIMVQAFALFIEEFTIHKRKRDVILNMIDHERESRMIAEQRELLIEFEDEISLEKKEEIEVVSIN